MIGPLLGWLSERSDLVSPILVKEVRQMVRGRDFAWAFAGSLLAGITIAFMGAAEGLAGNTTAGRWTFIWLISCLGVLGLAVIPLGAFSALRNERIEQTLDLMMLTGLSPRRIVLGKLLAQAVKLATLFAGIAPFVAMSFLLGGIDLVTIAIWINVVFLASLWMSALGLFLSTLMKSRAMSGLVYGGMGVGVLLLITATRAIYISVTNVRGFASSAAPSWRWALGVGTAIGLATLTNLLLLAEHRLAPATINRVTPVRLGFFVQFLVIAGACAAYVAEPAQIRSGIVEVLGVTAGLHLALVALFAPTEDLLIPRLVLQRIRESIWRHPLLAMFRPGGGWGALYVLVQMALLLVVARILDASVSRYGWLLAMCGYICFFSGVPAVVCRTTCGRAGGSLHLRAAILVLVVSSLVLPDLLHYFFWQPDVLNLTFGRRHLVNPFRTLGNWRTVEANGWFILPAVIGVIGFASYVWLIAAGMTSRRATNVDEEPAADRAPQQDRADVLG